MKVALIDDNNSARTSLARLIKTAGIEVVSFSSAQEFLEDPVRNHVDCAVTDVRMPGVDGFKLQETLARTVPYLSVVFITGHADIPISVRAILSGAVDFLEKPIDDEALLEAIRRAAGRSRDQKTARADLGDLQRRYSFSRPASARFPIGDSRTTQQTSWRRSRHYRKDHQSSPSSGDVQDEVRIVC